MFGILASTDRLRFPAPLLAFVLFFAWATISTLLSWSPAHSSATLFELSKSIIIFLVIVNAIRSQRQVQLFALLVVACFLVYPVRGAVINYFTGNLIMGRVIWNYIYSNPNDLAALSILALGVCVSVFIWRDVHKLLRIVSAAVGCLLVVVILLTQSRGAFLGLMLGMTVPVLPRIFRNRRMFLLAVIAGLSTVYFTPPEVWNRLGGISKLRSASTIAEADKEGSAAQRLEIQRTATRVALDHPVFGVGIGLYGQANAAYSPALGVRDTHNTYLNLAAEVGVPGLLLWICIPAVVLIRARQARKAQSDVPALQTQWLERAIAAFLIAGYFGTYWRLTLLYLALGLLWCCIELNRNPHTHSIESPAQSSANQRNSLKNNSRDAQLPRSTY